MPLRHTWILAVGLGLALAVLAGPGAGRSAAAPPSPLCIGPEGTFVTCGAPDQGSVVPTTTTTVGGPTTTTPASTAPGTTLPGTTLPGRAGPTATTLPGGGVTRLLPFGARPVSPGEQSDVIVVGIVATVLLGAGLVGLIILVSPGRARKRAGSKPSEPVAPPN